MKKWIFILTFMMGSTVHAGNIEAGYPIKKLNGVRISVLQLTMNDRSNCYYKGSLCIFPGLHIAKVKSEDGKNDVSFLGVNIFAQFNAGPFWSRYGFGWGRFNKKTEEIRSRWDFNLNMTAGWKFTKRFGTFLGWYHWSNGRSFAERLKIVKYWPPNNDGGNTLLGGLVYEYNWK